MSLRKVIAANNAITKSNYHKTVSKLLGTNRRFQDELLPDLPAVGTPLFALRPSRGMAPANPSDLNATRPPYICDILHECYADVASLGGGGREPPPRAPTEHLEHLECGLVTENQA